MSIETKAAPTIEELEAKLAERREAREKAERQQELIDRTAQFDLEDEHGPLRTVELTNWKAGLPKLVFLRPPTRVEYKRFTDQIRRASVNERQKAALMGEAQELLAKACWVYPVDGAEKEALLEAAPGILATIGNIASSLGEGKARDEGKG